jgi:hypothetical protein
MMPRVLIPVCSVALGLAWPSAASAYCRRANPVWSDLHPARIVIHASLADEMRHPYGPSPVTCTSDAACGPDGLCVPTPGGTTNTCLGRRWTRQELLDSVQWVVARINDDAGADLPLVYVDTTATSTCTWLDHCHDPAGPPFAGCRMDDSIVLIPDNCGVPRVSFTDLGGSIYDRRHLIHIPRSNFFDDTKGAGERWSHAFGYGGTDFEMVLLHELGHALGLAHPDGTTTYDTCLPSPANLAAVCPAPGDLSAPPVGCPVMLSRGVLFSNHTWGDDDINGLRNLYGIRTPPLVQAFERLSGTSTFSEVAAADVDFMGPVAAATWRGPWRSTLSVAGRRRRDTNNGVNVFTWDWGSGAMTSVGTGIGGFLRSHGTFGLTETPTHRIVAQHVMRQTSDARRYRRRIYALSAPLGSSAWTGVLTDPPSGALDDTLHAGVSVAYDPWSGGVLYSMRDDTAQIVMIWQFGAEWSAPIATGIYSYTTPAIACGAEECIVVGVEVPAPVAGSTSVARRLFWRRFQTAPGGRIGWTTGAVTPYAFRGQPTVAAVDRSGPVGWDYTIAVTDPALISAGVHGTALYTLNLPWDSSTVSLSPSIQVFPGRRAAAAVGSDGIYAELFSVTAP